MPAELAKKTGTTERYVREWLNAQAAGGYVTYDAGHRQLLAVARAGVHARRREQPGLSARRVPARDLGREVGAEDHRCVPERRRLRLARARSRPVRRHGALLPAELRRQSRVVVDPGAPGRRGRSCAAARRSPTSAAATARRRSCWRRRIRSRSSSASTTTGRRSRRAQGRGESRRRRSRDVRAGAGEGVSRQGLRPRRVLRLPARHGRSGRRGDARAALAREGRDVDDRRAVRERSRRGQPQPDRPRVLLGVDADLHARLALAGSRPGPRRPGRRGTDRATWSAAAGSRAFRRATETPFNLVFEAKA